MNAAQRRSTGRYSLLRVWLLLTLLAALLLVATSPALAHKKKPHDAPQTVQPGVQPAAQPGAPAAAPIAATEHGEMGEMMDGMAMGMDRSRMSFFERLIDWFGRLIRSWCTFRSPSSPPRCSPPSQVGDAPLLPHLSSFWWLPGAFLRRLPLAPDGLRE